MEHFKTAIERRVERLEQDLAKLETAVEDVANTLLAIKAVMEAVAERNESA